jgi:PAS domain S-box-containing protein
MTVKNDTVSESENNSIHELELNYTIAQISSVLLKPLFSIYEIKDIILESAKRITGSEGGFISSVGEGGYQLFYRLMRLEKSSNFEKDGKWDYMMNSLSSTILSCFKGKYRAFYDNSPEIQNNQKEIKNILFSPAMMGNRVMGEITLINSREGYTEKDFETIKKLAELFAITIHRRISEEELIKSRRKYRDLVEKINDILYSVNENGIITYINPVVEVLSGYKPSELLGMNFIELVYREDVDFVKKQFEEISKGHGGNIEYRICTKAGEVKWISASNKPIFSSGRFIGVQGVMRDITERKKVEIMQSELTDVLKLMNKILRHDILNNLTIISGCIEVYNETKDKKLLSRAINSIKKSIELINNMKELESLLHSEDGFKMYSIREIIESVTLNYQVDCRIRGDCSVMVNGAFSSVIDNIVRNAITHGKSENIEIDIENKDNICEIRIADFGEGIPDEIKDKIFDEGFKFGEAGNSGLGLYIVKKLIDKYGGEITVEDNKPRGTVFILRLKTSGKSPDQHFVEFGCHN